MRNVLVFLIVLLSFTSCKTSQFKAKDKKELSKICTDQFPRGQEVSRKTDTMFKEKEVLVPVFINCDSIGEKKVDVPIKYTERVVKEKVYITDPAQDYYMLTLELEKEALEHNLRYLKNEQKRKQVEFDNDIKAKDKAHKSELKKAGSFERKVKGFLTGGVILMILGFVARAIIKR